MTERTRKVYQGERNYRLEKYKEYVVYAKDSKIGKKKKISVEDNSTFKYDYWNIGDVFRFYGNGINNYEKYDKTKDTISFCLACRLSK